MADETNGYSKGVQVSSTIGGDLYNLRAGDGEQLAEVVESVAVNGEKIVKGLSTFKQAVVAYGVLTGQTKAQAAPQGTAGASGPPPSGGAPMCCTGQPMKDLASKGYKHRYYCNKARGQGNQCPPRD